jgi:hypothetical protein
MLLRRGGTAHCCTPPGCAGDRTLLRELPARIEHRPPLRQRTDGAARTAGGRAAEMLAGEPSDTEDSDAAATVYAEPKLYRTRREQHASLSPDLGETAATARYRERLWSGEMGRRYYRLRAVEKKRTLRKELEARVRTQRNHRLLALDVVRRGWHHPTLAVGRPSGKYHRRRPTPCCPHPPQRGRVAVRCGRHAPIACIGPAQVCPQLSEGSLGLLPRCHANDALCEGADVEHQHCLRAPREAHRIELHLPRLRHTPPHPAAIGGHRHQVRPHAADHGLRAALELRAQGGRPSSTRIPDARRRRGMLVMPWSMRRQQQQQH